MIDFAVVASLLTIDVGYDVALALTERSVVVVGPRLGWGEYGDFMVGSRGVLRFLSSRGVDFLPT